MLKYSIQKDTHLSFTEGLTWAKELIEIEELQKDHVPNEVFSYTKSLQAVDNDGDDYWEDLEEEEEFGMWVDNDDDYEIDYDVDDM